MQQVDEFSVTIKEKQDQIDEIREEMVERGSESWRNFEAIEKKFEQNDVLYATKAGQYDLEIAIEERVHNKKFNLMAANITTYMKQKDFYAFEEKMNTRIAGMIDRMVPLANTNFVQQKVADVKTEFEKKTLTLASKEDCAADKEETLQSYDDIKNTLDKVVVFVENLSG